MDLIDVDGLCRESILTVLAESLIVPDIVIGLIEDRRIIRPRLKMPCEWIALLINTVIGSDNAILVAVPLLSAGNLLLPDTGIAQLEHLA